MSGHFACCFYNLQVGKTSRRAKVKGIRRLSSTQVFNSQNMGISQVERMDIIADIGSVWSIVIVSKNGNLLTFALSHLEHNGQEMGFWSMVLTNRAVGLGTRHIEITQSYKLDAIGLVCPAHNGLHHKLALTIRIDRLLRSRFQNRNFLRNAISRRSRRKDNVFNAAFLHDLQKRNHAGCVIVKILERINHRLSDQ